MQANSSSLHIWLVWDKNLKMKKEVFQKLLEKQEMMRTTNLRIN